MSSWKCDRRGHRPEQLESVERRTPLRCSSTAATPRAASTPMTSSRFACPADGQGAQLRCRCRPRTSRSPGSARPAARSTAGYVVEMAIDLGEAAAGTFEGVDFQINDRARTVRESASRNWADPTGAGYQTASHWGVLRLLSRFPPKPRPRAASRANTIRWESTLVSPSRHTPSTRTRRMALVENFNQITPENSLKPEGWYDDQHHFRMSDDARNLLTFASRERHQGLRPCSGLALAGRPDWFFQADEGCHDTNDNPGVTSCPLADKAHDARNASAGTSRTWRRPSLPNSENSAARPIPSSRSTWSTRP